MHGNHYELCKVDNWSRDRLFKSDDLVSVAQFIAEKEAPHREPAVPDGGGSWRARLPESIDGGER